MAADIFLQLPFLFADVLDLRLVLTQSLQACCVQARQHRQLAPSKHRAHRASRGTSAGVFGSCNLVALMEVELMCSSERYPHGGMQHRALKSQSSGFPQQRSTWEMDQKQRAWGSPPRKRLPQSRCRRCSKITQLPQNKRSSERCQRR